MEVSSPGRATVVPETSPSAGSDSALSEKPKVPKTTRNGSIEGLRGFSALAVLLVHSIMMVRDLFFPFTITRAFDESLKAISRGSVCLFFMISGYLIVQSLVRHSNIRVFLLNRVVRIYPVFATLHLIIYTLGPLARYDWMGNLRGKPLDYIVSFLANLFFLPGTISESKLPIAQSNAWSLSYEFVFYLVACLYFAGFRERAHRGWLAALLLTLAVGITGGYVFSHPLAIFFICGVITYRYQEQLRAWKAPVWWRESGILWLILTFMFVRTNIFTSIQANIFTSAIFGLLFFASIVPEWGLFSRLMQCSPFTYLGRISYSLYLTHPFAVTFVREVMKRVAPYLGGKVVSFVVYEILGLALALVVAHCSYQWIEVAFTNRFLRLKKA